MTSLEEVRARFARDQGLPFADALTERSILDALDEHGVPYRDRLFSPATTIWGFLSQVLRVESPWHHGFGEKRRQSVRRRPLTCRWGLAKKGPFPGNGG